MPTHPAPLSPNHPGSPAPRILIVEDERPIADMLGYALKTEGFSTDWVMYLQDASERLNTECYDLLILDVGLPDGNGFEWCKALRRHNEVPVMFLTARADEVDRVVGLEIGADDYVVKPFSPREVCARAKAILKRAHATAAPPAAATSAAGQPTSPPPAAPLWQLDEERGRIRYQGQMLDLTRYEYLLLRTLVSRAGQILSRHQLMDLVWQHSDADGERTVDTHVKTLRAKLKAIAPDDDPIETHRGLGYCLRKAG